MGEQAWEACRNGREMMFEEAISYALEENGDR
jgi:hypothetical protein